MPALVAIIGRPNVGKSTLFNRILGKRLVIESPEPGTTRDPITASYSGDKVDILFVDTGGLMFEKTAGQIENDVQKQALLAIADADVILFCIDTREEITAGEQEVISLLRKKAGKTPVLLVGTKADGKAPMLTETDLASLGVSPYPVHLVAALQQAGVFELVTAIENILVQRGFQKDPEKTEDVIPRITVLGRPNVGKSSLINALSRSEKLIVSEVAGTTRDAIDIEITHQKKKFIFIDTAGIRRKSKIEKGIEEYSIFRSLLSLRQADITLLLLDAATGVTHQDKHILDHILDAKSGLLILVNKWDLFEKEEQQQAEFLASLRRELDFIPWVPVLFISATKHRNLQKIFPLLEDINTERKKRISTTELNVFLQQVQHIHPLSGIKNMRPRIKYGAQVGVAPPHFVFHGTKLQFLHFSSRRYLENRLREVFGFEGTPLDIQMIVKK